MHGSWGPPGAGFAMKCAILICDLLHYVKHVTASMLGERDMNDTEVGAAHAHERVCQGLADLTVWACKHVPLRPCAVLQAVLSASIALTTAFPASVAPHSAPSLQGMHIFCTA